MAEEAVAVHRHRRLSFRPKRPEGAKWRNPLTIISRPPPKQPLQPQTPAPPPLSSRAKSRDPLTIPPLLLIFLPPPPTPQPLPLVFPPLPIVVLLSLLLLNRHPHPSRSPTLLSTKSLGPALIPAMPTMNGWNYITPPMSRQLLLGPALT